MHACVQAPGYRLHYFDMVPPVAPAVEPDPTVCYHKCASQDDPSKPWTQDVRETEVLASITWASCGKECQYHMGEGQWEDVEIAMNIAFEENHASDDEYVDDDDDLTRLHAVAHVEARVPDTGEILMCGGCEQEFFSQSGLSTRCIGCR